MPKTARDDPKARSDGHAEAAGGLLTSHYEPGIEGPLASYAIIAGTYSAIFGSSLIALRARGHQLPTRIAIGDVFLIGIASHKLSRLIAKDKATSFARAAFTKFQKPGRPGRGRGATVNVDRQHDPPAGGDELLGILHGFSNQSDVQIKTPHVRRTSR